MAADGDLLRGEVDRQLAEVRAACDGLATRSGILVAAESVAAALVAPHIKPDQHLTLLILMLSAFGLSVVAGAIALAPWLKVGPVATALAGWLGGSPTPTTSGLLYDSKLVILSANLNRLLTIRIFFAIQALMTIVAVGLALSYSAWK
jgi:hypothetical protein